MKVSQTQQQKTQDQFELLKSVLDSVQGFISLIDINGKYLMANKSLLNALGIDENKINGNDLGFLKIDGEFAEFVKDFLHDPKLQTLTDVRKLKFKGSNEGRWFLMTLTRIQNTDLLVCSSIEIHDEILLHKENERQRALIEQSSKMVALGQMAGGIAHEINNPLAIIDVHSQKIRRILKAPEIDISKITASLDTLDKTVTRIVKIIGGLRTIARGSDHDPMELSSLDKIIDSTMEFCRERFKNNGIALNLGTVPDIKLECRESQLVQVLVNLLNNGYEAVEKLEERWVRIEFQETADFVKLLVSDSGPGIPEQVAAQIMQPFFTTKPVGKGTGLGLSISRRLIEGHGGHLIYDASAKNTQFIIELPKPKNEIKSKIA